MNDNDVLTVERAAADNPGGPESVLLESIQNSRRFRWDQVATGVILSTINPVYGFLYGVGSMLFQYDVKRHAAKHAEAKALELAQAPARRAEERRKFEQECLDLDECRRKHGAWVGPAPEL